MSITLREALCESSPELMEWAKELDLPLDEPCQCVSDAGMACGGVNDPDWSSCRPLSFFTGPYYDWDRYHETNGEEGKTENVWLVLDDEEWSIVMRDDQPVLGWWASRGEIGRIDDNRLRIYADPKHAVVPSRLSIKIPKCDLVGLYDEQ